jgi:hypothetical protein
MTMDVSALNNQALNWTENTKTVIPSNNSNPTSNEVKNSVDNELPWGVVHLSPESFIRYGYWRKFCDFFDGEKDSSKPLNQDTSVFSKFANVYLDCKTEILKNYSGDDQKTQLQLMENAANEAVESYSKSLARSFANFFNYSSNIYRDRLGKDTEAIFNDKVFTERLITVSHEVIKIVNGAMDNTVATQQIENYLSNNGDNSRIENMTFKDITVLSQCLKKTKLQSAKIGDLSRVRAESWNTAIGEYSESFSQNIQELLKKTAKKNLEIASLESDYVKKYQKYSMNQMEVNKQIYKFSVERNTLKTQIENNSEISFRRKLQFDERIASLEKKIKDCSKQLKALETNHMEIKMSFLGKLQEKYLEESSNKDNYISLLI